MHGIRELKHQGVLINKVSDEVVSEPALDSPKAKRDESAHTEHMKLSSWILANIGCFFNIVKISVGMSLDSIKEFALVGGDGDPITRAIVIELTEVDLVHRVLYVTFNQVRRSAPWLILLPAGSKERTSQYTHHMVSTWLAWFNGQGDNEVPVALLWDFMDSVSVERP